MSKFVKSLIAAAVLVAAWLFLFSCSEKSTVPEFSVPSVAQARELHGSGEIEIEIVQGITFETYRSPGSSGSKVLFYTDPDSCFVVEILPDGDPAARSLMSKGMWDCIVRNGKICRQLYPDLSVPGAQEGYNRCYAKGLTSCVVAYTYFGFLCD